MQYRILRGLRFLKHVTGGLTGFNWLVFIGEVRNKKLSYRLETGRQQCISIAVTFYRRNDLYPRST